jgi:hypothetical protein
VGLWRSAKAFWRSLVFCREVGLFLIIIESSDPTIISMLNSEECCTELGWISHDIRSMVQHLENISFCFSMKSCNLAAQALVGFAKERGGNCLVRRLPFLFSFFSHCTN